MKEYNFLFGEKELILLFKKLIGLLFCNVLILFILFSFLIGIKEREIRKQLRQKIFNKTNTFYQQFKTLNYATKNRSNFKKSGAFAFSSFSGSNFDKAENEWKELADYELQNYYIHSFCTSNLMKKINSDYKKKQLTLKSCTTFKEIAKCPHIYT